MPSIDLNCDLGEGTGADDLALLDIVTSANIACGGHAGDEASMTETVQAALARGVAIGAHPSYPDRANFGRLALDMPLKDLSDSIFNQLKVLDQITRSLGGRLSHVKAHGALYHRAMSDQGTAAAIASAVSKLDPTLNMVAMPRTIALRVWNTRQFRSLIEGFADRRYQGGLPHPPGPPPQLVPRSSPDALITDPAEAASQALALLEPSPTHHDLDRPHTICIHSDTPGAVAVAQAVRRTLEHSGINVRAAGL